MDLIALAVPFFLLALLLELAFDRWCGTGNTAFSLLGLQFIGAAPAATSRHAA